MMYLIILGLLGLLMVVLSILFAIEAIDRILTLVDRVREILKMAVLDGIQVWSSGHRSSIDIDREKAKLELTQDFGQIRLYEYKQNLKCLKHKNKILK